MATSKRALEACREMEQARAAGRRLRARDHEVVATCSRVRCEDAEGNPTVPTQLQLSPPKGGRWELLQVETVNSSRWYHTFVSSRSKVVDGEALVVAVWTRPRRKPRVGSKTKR